MKIRYIDNIWPGFATKRMDIVIETCRRLAGKRPYSISIFRKKISAEIMIDTTLAIQVRISFGHIYPRFRLMFHGPRKDVVEQGIYRVKLEAIRKDFTDEMLI